jgi:hypothetical protein
MKLNIFEAKVCQMDLWKLLPKSRMSLWTVGEKVLINKKIRSTVL